MMKKLLLLFILSGLVKTGFPQDLSLYEKHWYINKSDTLPWRILLPENYEPTKKYPLIFFLHGAGERGNDNAKQLVHGAKLFLQPAIRKNFPAIIVFPQCPQNSFWGNVDIRMENGKRVFDFKDGGEPTIAMKLADELLKELLKKYPVERKRVYIGGLSMGGMGTFEMVRRNPKLFAAAFPICGGGYAGNVSNLRKVKWWVFHGNKDDVVLPRYSEEMVKALEGVRATVKFTLYPNANHNSWDPAFAEPDLLSWLFSQHK